MKLSLSVRIAESSSRKDHAEMPLDQLAPLARAAGFEGLSMRASALSVDSPPDKVVAARRLLDRENLVVSMVMGNVALAANTPDAPAVLRHIKPHLDLAEALGAHLVRIMLQHADDVTAVRYAADEAAERGLSLAQQTHWGTLCETVEEAIDLVGKVDRPNFGITFEPANLLACGGDSGPDAARRLAPYMKNFYFQNICLEPSGTHLFKSRRCGDVALRYVALDDPGGIPVAPLIAALADAGYDGWITVHQPLREGQTVPDAIDEAARVFLPLVK